MVNFLLTGITRNWPEINQKLFFYSNYQQFNSNYQQFFVEKTGRHFFRLYSITKTLRDTVILYK